MTTQKSPGACPDREQLKQFTAGRAPSETAKQIEGHLEDCAQCSDTLNLLGEKSDTLVHGLRSGETDAGHCSEADKDRVVKLIESVGPDQAEGSTATGSSAEIPKAIQKVVNDLTRSDLLSEQELEEVMSNLSAKEQENPREFAKALIRQKKLTKFQATAVYQGKARSLTFGQYIILDKLGQGGMGMVYKAQHRRMKREVAIKVLPGGALDNEDSVNRFYQEVEAAARLLHPNIVTAFDAGQKGKSHFLVMECVNGKDLSVLIREKGRLPITTVVDLITQAALGLEYAHQQGLTHRDIKPANLLLSNDGVVKILDMGLARLSSEIDDDGLTKSGQIMGTVDYMAPEQAVNTRAADARADIYSLGCTLYRLLTDQPMYDGDTLMNKLMSHANDPPPDLQAARPDVSDQLKDVFEKMTAKSADERQQSMSEVIAELQACPQSDSDSVAAAPLVDTQRRDSQSESRLSEFFDADRQSKSNIEVTSQMLDVEAPIDQTMNLQMEPTADIKRADIKPADVKPEPRPTTKSKLPLWIPVAVAAGVAGVLLLAATIFFFPTKDGVLRVEINDPDVEVTVKGSDIVIKGAEKKDITLTPGEHVLHVKRGDFEFDTKSLHLKKGKMVTVKVELLDGRLQVASGGAVIGSQAVEADPPQTMASESAPPVNVRPLAERGLIFDGDDIVTLDSLKLNCDTPVTFEAWISSDEPFAGFIININRADGNSSDMNLSHSNTRLGWTGFVRTTSTYTYFQTNSGVVSQGGEGPTHLAMVRDKDELRIYVDGLLRKKTPLNADLVYPLDERIVKLGQDAKGRIHGVRISRGTRYKEKKFTPQHAFAPDADTLALYHFDEGTGDVLKDSSGNGRHGKIEGARWVRVSGSPAAVQAPVAKVATSGLTFSHPEAVAEIPLFPFKTQRPVTIEAWVTKQSPDSSSLIDWYGDARFQLTFTPEPGANYWGNRTQLFGPYPFAVELNRPMHLAATWDGTTQQLFLDGRLLGNLNTPEGRNPLPQRVGMYIGGRPPNPTTKNPKHWSSFPGVIHRVRISDGVRYPPKPFTPERVFDADEKTLALYQMDEDTGDVLKDSSGNGHHGKITGARWVRANEAASTPGAPKFGASLAFDGDEDLVVFDSLRSEDGPFTVECWIHPEDAQVRNGYLVNWQRRSGRVKMTVNSGPRLSFNRIVEPGLDYSVYDVPIPRQPVHVAGVWNGHTGKFFVDGVRRGEWVSNHEFGLDKSAPTSLGGHLVNGKKRDAFAGRIFGVRFSSVARYDEEFRPQRRFTSDEHTLALYHFDEGSGEVLKDSSGNGHHGKIMGASWVRATNQPTSDRAVAEWILTNGGGLETNIEPGKGLTTVAELPSGPFRITRIEKLTLSMPTAEADEAVQRLGSLTECEVIRIVDMNLSDAGLTFLSTLPRLHELQFIRVRGVDGTGLAHLRRPENLTGLSLNGSKFSDEAFNQVARFSNLTFLDLNGSGINDAQLARLAGLKKMNRLWLPSNPITDAGLKHLADMTNLRHLTLSKTQVTANGVAEFKKALPACEITWGERAEVPASP